MFRGRDVEHTRHVAFGSLSRIDRLPTRQKLPVHRTMSALEELETSGYNDDGTIVAPTEEQSSCPEVRDE